MTIEEYERKFYQLLGYAPHLVGTEDKMMARFRKGLRIDIKGILAAHVINDFGELVKLAEQVELALEVEAPQKQVETPAKRTWDNRNQGKGNFQQKKGKFGSGNGSGAGPSTRVGGANTRAPEIKPLCPKCEKHHNGECLLGMGACFYCHEKGHNFYTCPKKVNNVRDNGEGKEPERRGNARFFALAQQEDANDSDTITGMLYILGTPVVVLFDSGASHSFISTKLCELMNIDCEVENLALNISIPSGDNIKTNRLVRNMKLHVGSRELDADLYCIEMQDFDVILGMDWLSRNYPNIKCREREVVFEIPNEEKFTFYGAKVGRAPIVISAMKAMEILRKEKCEGYLVNMIGVEEEGPSIEKVPIV